MFRVVKLRKFGARDERSALLREAGLIGAIDMYSAAEKDGGQVRCLRLSEPIALSCEVRQIALLLHPEFLAFNGDSFLVRGIETDDRGRQFVQEWWGRRIASS